MILHKGFLSYVVSYNQIVVLRTTIKLYTMLVLIRVLTLIVLKYSRCYFSRPQSTILAHQRANNPPSSVLLEQKFANFF